MGSGIVLIMFVVMAVVVWMEFGQAELYSTKLMHRFSEEIRAIRVSRNRREGNGSFGNDEIWPQKGSSMYYRRLLSSDLRRQKLKMGAQFRYVFPSEGSTTLPLGNDFGW